MKNFKIEVDKVRTLLSSLMVVWQSPNHEVLALLLQNLSFDGSEAVNYSITGDFQRSKDIVEALKQMKKYNTSCPVTQFICDEIDMLYTGYVVMADV